jgi:glycosyltransferase involved in cell wall biosynthesis
MKVACFTESLPPLVDGVSHTLSYLRRTLDAEKVDYRFFSPFLPADEDWADRVVHVLSVPFPLYTKYRISLPAFHDLRHLLRRFAPDIIHICSPFFLGLSAYRYAAEAGIPVVNSFHTRFVSYLKYYGLGYLERYGWRYLRWFYNRGDICFVPSRATIRELEGRGFSNLRLWERGIDPSRFSPAFADRSLKNNWSPDGDPVALFVGRLVKEKDVETLLEAHNILIKRKIPYKLVFVGDGPLRGQIERDAPDAYLAGHLRDDRLSRAYASADIFVFPSTTESFGNVVLEAAASGLPVIGASEGGVGDLIRDGETGFLTTPNDAGDLALKMEALLTNETLRNAMAVAAMEFASQKDWNRINRALLENYETLIKERKTNRAFQKRYHIPGLISGHSG